MAAPLQVASPLLLSTSLTKYFIHFSFRPLSFCLNSASASFYIITGLLRGGELFDRISSGRFTEEIASDLTRMMLKAVLHMHEQVCVHMHI